jgi:2-isopropylmalate synthase
MVTNKHVSIFDTTLRDGEQSPGVSLTFNEKLEIAELLSSLNVDVIEAGFPAASKGDFQAVKAIAENITNSCIAGLSRSTQSDIDKALNALSAAKKKRLHLFIASSDIHMKYKLQMTKDQVLKTAVDSVQYAKKEINDIEFSAEDATRSDRTFLLELYNAVIDAGATTINVPDTVGYFTPEEMYDLISFLKKNLKKKPIISVHCHNDLGLAVANSLAAIRAGAGQVECTINGIGERSGNCSLEEFVMTLKTRNDFYDKITNINTKALFEISQRVSDYTGMDVQANKAIVGKNAFAHESGIHQHGVLKHASTYEIMNPEDIGWLGNKIVLGKHSGRFALKNWLVKRDLTFNNEDFEVFFNQFKLYADEHKDIDDQDLENIVSHFLNQRTII